MGPPGETQAFPAELLGQYLASADKSGGPLGGRRRRSVAEFQNEMADMVGNMAKKPVELKEGVTIVVSRLFQQINRLRSEVKKMRFPTGQEDNPAPTCRDIKMINDKAEDGRI